MQCEKKRTLGICFIQVDVSDGFDLVKYAIIDMVPHFILAADSDTGGPVTNGLCGC